MSRTDNLEGRVGRLRQELVEERVPLPIDHPNGDRLVRELAYALRPPVHERRVPPYGALVWLDGRARFDHCVSEPVAIDVAGYDPAVVRRLADGRASFVAVAPDGPSHVLQFRHRVDTEARLVDLQETTGAVVIARGDDHFVRVVTDDGVVEFDGVRWTFKPLAVRHLAAIRRLVPGADVNVLDQLLDLCVHWLSAERVGATLVWYLADVDPSEATQVDLSRAFVAPVLDVGDSTHVSALVSVLGQVDRAALVRPDGQVSHIGASLHNSARSAELVPAFRGTRHTSARRFSYDEPECLVFVVSEDGPLTVFGDGARMAAIAADDCRTGERIDAPPAHHTDPHSEIVIDCRRCHRPLLVDVVRFDRWTGGPDTAPCPVCGNRIEADVYRMAIRGVTKTGRPTGAGMHGARNVSPTTALAKPLHRVLEEQRLAER
ncbi:MAG: diadenylate cyclase [Actinomycetota bacterium]|nr:diadenylate cyclase [Actinomycetota bacterium]